MTKASREAAQRVEREHAQRFPAGCDILCHACVVRLQLTDADVARRHRERIAAKFKHGGPRKGVADA